MAKDINRGIQWEQLVLSAAFLLLITGPELIESFQKNQCLFSCNLVLHLVNSKNAA